jgi:hypothetical protein
MRRPSVRQRRQDAAESDATASQAFGQHAGPTLAYSPLSHGAGHRGGRALQGGRL